MRHPELKDVLFVSAEQRVRIDSPSSYSAVSRPVQKRAAVVAKSCVCALGLMVAGQVIWVAELGAQDGRVQVEIEGLQDPERRNVMATLSIAAARTERTIAEARVRRLHARAPGEISLALQPYGLYGPEIESDLRYQGEVWIGRYVVTPGPRVIFREVDIRMTGDGVNEAPFLRLQENSPLTDGAPLSHATYEQEKARLLAAAAELGYLDARFDRHEIRVDRESLSAGIVLWFETGPQFRFGPVTFEQDVVRPELLQGRVGFRRGEPFSVSSLLELQASLGDSPYCSRVEVVPRRDLAEDLEVPVEVHLVPSRPQRYQVGVGFSTNSGPRLSFDVALRRLNRSGHRAEAEISASLIEQRISGRYLIPFAYPNTELLTFAAGYAHLDPTTSTSDVILVSTSLGRSRGAWQETFTVGFHHDAFTVGADTGVADLLVPGAGWSLTRSNNRVFPTRGGRLRFEVQGARSGAGSSASFLRVKATGKLVRSLGPRTRVLLRAEGGATVTSQLRELPPSFRFFAGGDQSIRGYQFRSLGPTDAAGNVIGGRLLATASVELEQRFLERWGVAVFLDGGNAFDSLSQGFEYGVGGGVRWISPVGLVRIDVAVAVSETERPVRLHVTIGPGL